MNTAGSADIHANDKLTRASMGIDAVRVVLATLMILLGPLVAMQFSHSVQWTGLDFGVAAVLLAGAGWTCLRASSTIACPPFASVRSARRWSSRSRCPAAASRSSAASS